MKLVYAAGGGVLLVGDYGSSWRSFPPQYLRRCDTVSISQLHSILYGVCLVLLFSPHKLGTHTVYTPDKTRTWW